MVAPTGEEDELAVRYPDPQTIRVAVPVKQAALALGVLLVVLVLIGLWQKPAQPSLLTSPASLSTSPATSTTAAAESVVMAVVGHVAHPGLVTLTPGARVAEALALVEPLSGAETHHINLAEKIVDGQQIVVPAPGQEAPAPAGPTGKVNINTATAEELTTLPGVGQVTAEAIISYRETHGPFTEVGQLQQVKGIGPAKFSALEPEATV